jgi:hypothetical protein
MGRLLEYFLVCGLGPDLQSTDNERGYSGTSVYYQPALLDQFPPSDISELPPPPPQLPLVRFSLPCSESSPLFIMCIASCFLRSIGIADPISSVDFLSQINAVLHDIKLLLRHGICRFPLSPLLASYGQISLNGYNYSFFPAIWIRILESTIMYLHYVPNFGQFSQVEEREMTPMLQTA